MEIPKENLSGIYRILNTHTQRFLVGSSKHVHTRLVDHLRYLRNNKHPNRHIQRAWNKSGEEAFIFEVIEPCSEDILLERETYWIQTTWEINYNINRDAKSPCAGRCHTKATKRKMSIAHKGKVYKPWSIESRKRRSEQMTGKQLSKETRAKMSRTRKGRKETEMARQNRLEMMRTDEYRTKLSNTMKKVWAARKGKI